MRSFYLSFFLLLGTASAAFAQTFAIKGRITDRGSGESLPGASVIVTGTTQGGVSDGSGSFSIKGLAAGTYTVKASYIGYLPIEQKVTITNHDETVAIRLAEDNATLNEVQVVAEVAVERETPVAFSSVNEVKLRESLAGRDLPLILNETPGVYATQSGGGTGDSRISIRGFDQRNVAVMVNGVPVNDMENGQVFWSNWDLGDVTKNLQVQRGLTASKLSVPSVGGTLNVLTKGFDAKRGGRVRQEIGFNSFGGGDGFGDLGYFKTSLMLSSGQMKGDWAVTVYGSRRTNTGWADHLFDDAWTYFGTVSKRMGKHQLSLTALGSPQKHGQRSFASRIGYYSHAKAEELGASTKDPELGYRYNPNWNVLNRYTINADGSRTDHYEDLNERVNFYHKPQINLNHFWNISDKLFLSNVVYASFGNGGGTGLVNSSIRRDSLGRLDLQSVYDANYTGPHRKLQDLKATGQPTQTVLDPERQAINYIRASYNSHRWYGFISSLDYKLSETTTLSAGLDGRYYRGIHYQTVNDLMGADYALDVSTPSIYERTPKAGSIDVTRGDQAVTNNTYQKLREGDKVNYHYNGLITWGGGYGQVEYKKGVFSGFFSGTGSLVSYKRVDYFKPRSTQLADGRTVALGNALVPVTRLDANGQPVLDGNGQPIQDQYTRFESVTVPVSHGPTATLAPTDTTLFIGHGGAQTYNGITYRSVDLSGAKPVESEWVRLPGFTVKSGFNYNITEDNNFFFNIGYLSRAQFFNPFVFTLAGDRIRDLKNENIFSVEAGYAISLSGLKASLNAYRTLWKNRSLSISGGVDDATGLPVTANVGGLDALHQGVELDVAQEITRQLQLNAAFSIGDWRWNSAGSYRITSENGQELASGSFNPKGVHVGGSAQNQFMLGVRYEPLTGLYLRPTYTLFTKHFVDFNPNDFAGTDTPQDVARLPTYRNVDLHAGYSHDVNAAGHPYRLTFNASVLNLLNEFYITDAPFRSNAGIDPANPATVEVFFNQGRRATMGLTVDF